MGVRPPAGGAAPPPRASGGGGGAPAKAPGPIGGKPIKNVGDRDVYGVKGVPAPARVQITRRPFKDSIFYQVYPRSFADSDGNGVGDIPGITSRLDHVADLGANALWLGPIFPSPNYDHGYDITDHCAVAPELGTMGDFETLVLRAKALKLDLVLDLVLNHTSDEHAWFQESRKSRNNPKADWYIWRDPVKGGPPNNWRAQFGGTAWHFCPGRGQYYLHLFCHKQPDLNWENPEVRAACLRIMEFWLGKGVSGFRLDVMQCGKPEGLPDAADGRFRPDLERSHRYAAELREKIAEKHAGGIILVGELPGLSSGDSWKFSDPARKELDMVASMDHLEHDLATRWDTPSTFNAASLKRVLKAWDASVERGGWSSFFWGNHDWQRAASRYIADQTRHADGVKALHTILLTGRWTPFILQGDEIGMTNTTFTSMDQVRDVESHIYYRESLAKGLSHDALMAKINAWSRDHARTPMQWSDAPNAGFTTGEPWLGVNPNYVDLNVEKQQRDARSILQHIKRLIGLRRLMPALVYGSVEMHALDDTRLYACVRRLGEETVVVLVNLSPDPCEVQLPAGVVVGEKKLLMSNMEQPAGLDAELLTRPLQAYETRLVRVEAKPISTLTARLQLAQPPVPPDESSLRDS